MPALTGEGIMGKGPARPVISTASWAARKRVKERALGYRAVQVLQFVADHCAQHGLAPSYGTIRDALGFNDKSDVRRVVEGLERRGLLVRVASGAKRGPEWNQPVLRLVD